VDCCIFDADVRLITLKAWSADLVLDPGIPAQPVESCADSQAAPVPSSLGLKPAGLYKRLLQAAQMQVHLRSHCAVHALTGCLRSNPLCHDAARQHTMHINCTWKGVHIYVLHDKGVGTQ